MITLRQHREALAKNPNVYTSDLERVNGSVVNHLKKCGYPKVTTNRCKDLIEQYVGLIFDAQDNLPFFHVTGLLPYCWNAPMDWDKNYIRYQWGHLLSKNQNNSANDIKNLCLQSARCNQHIQTSMDIDEVLIWLDGSAVGNRTREVLEKRENLFRGKLWASLEKDLNQFR